MSKKIQKLILILLILFLGLAISTKVNARNWIDKYMVDGSGGDDNDNPGDSIGYNAHMRDENKSYTFCINHGIHYKATHVVSGKNAFIFEGDTRTNFGKYAGYCSIAGEEGVDPWETLNEATKADKTVIEYREDANYSNKALTMEYTLEGPVSALKYQDAAYVLTFTNDIGSNETQKAIWTTSINRGPNYTSTDLGNEGIAFKNFYDAIHSNGNDIFQDSIRDNTSGTKVAVNADDSYTVGPFNVSYPNGQYNGKNKFSWISNIYAVTDAGNVGVQVLLSNGTDVTSELGKDGGVSLNGVDFYIRFTHNSATRVEVQVDFGYIESCQVEMATYSGQQYKWYWKKVKLSDNCTVVSYYTAFHSDGTPNHIAAGGHDHGFEHDNDGPEHNVDEYACSGYYQRTCGGTKTYTYGGMYQCDKCHAYSGTPGSCQEMVDISPKPCTHIRECEHPIYAPLYVYVMTKEYFGTSQGILHVTENGGTANNGTAGIRLTNGIDLTMTISGKVFLDKDTGKTNTGNNIYDKGEELEGIEVRLFDSNNNQIGIALTDANGAYSFKELNALKKYYVQFTYNGMLYTNVSYIAKEDKTSKATEEGQGHTNNRQVFNSKFAEIGSYPENYKTTDCITGAVITNKTYLQEEIASLFKEVAKEVVANDGNEKQAYQTVINRHSNEAEIRQKIQFVADCRINAYTVEQYPLLDAFVIKSSWENLAGISYYPIYAGDYSQRNVNLGIKARTTFDIALYKDVYKAEVSVNGKTEIYNYDSRKDSGNGFSVGVSETDYLNGLRGAYQNSKTYTNVDQTREIEKDTYNMNMRTEEVANGQSTSYNANKMNADYVVNEDYSNLKTDGKNKDQRLTIYVTYKLAIRNQSSSVGAITEIVDYFDTNYKFIQAYVGNSKGEQIGDVTKYDTSLYGNEYKSTKNAYTTIYLRPNTQTDLTEGEEQYIYVKLQLIGSQNDAGTLLSNTITDKDTLNVINLAEINGYKTTEGLIDIDSNPGNLNISNISALTQDNIVNYPNIKSMYEDDTSRAPVVIYSLYDSRTLEGTVFEDSTGTATVKTGVQRTGNGKLDDGETKIEGVKVELIEIKDNEMIVRATTTTNSDGWYGFTGFLPGDYIIRYTYGADDKTAMTTSSTWYKGANETSYNGQDYQSTVYVAKNGTYWYTEQNGLSDAKDDSNRVAEVIKYSKSEYGTEIRNHKAEVFNAYVNPQASHITEEKNRELANELEEKTYRYAYTETMHIEVEYATQTTTGTQEHEHKITGVDFGIAQRPKSEITLDQDVKHIKVTASDGTILFDTEKGTNNLQWIAKGDIEKYDLGELVNIIMDEELINGAKLEITYNITVSNNSEKDIDLNGNEVTTRAKGILNYVSNNLNFDMEDNRDENGNELWEIVSKDSVQKADNTTYTNSTIVNLDGQAVILQATDINPLTSTLKPGETKTTTLKLKKILSTESPTDDLSYTNLAEIVEIENTVGRYDHGATPGNQLIDQVPQEHDTTGVNGDSTVTITPPTGSIYIYFVIGITSAAVLAVGIFLIKKFVINKKQQ